MESETVWSSDHQTAELTTEGRMLIIAALSKYAKDMPHDSGMATALASKFGSATAVYVQSPYEEKAQ